MKSINFTWPGLLALMELNLNSPAKRRRNNIR
jgi:hypothetical protein